jgi:hypothetical protein
VIPGVNLTVGFFSNSPVTVTALVFAPGCARSSQDAFAVPEPAHPARESKSKAEAVMARDLRTMFLMFKRLVSRVSRQTGLKVEVY